MAALKKLRKIKLFMFTVANIIPSHIQPICLACLPAYLLFLIFFSILIERAEPSRAPSLRRLNRTRIWRPIVVLKLLVKENNIFTRIQVQLTLFLFLILPNLLISSRLFMNSSFSSFLNRTVNTLINSPPWIRQEFMTSDIHFSLNNFKIDIILNRPSSILFYLTIRK